MTTAHRGPVTIVDACTQRGHGGSPTAVLIDNPGFTDHARRAVVREAGTSHAAFVDTDTGTVRFCTTQGELTNCGHGTIAAQAFLLHRSRAAEHHGRQRTGGRTFDTTAVQRDGAIEVWFDQGPIELRNGDPTGLDDVLGALCIGPDAVSPDDAPTVASPGTPRLLVPVRSTRTLFALRPDLRRLAAACRRHGYLGCFVHTTSPRRDRTVARMFAPAIGVGEDTVNANSTGCLAAHLHATTGRTTIQVEQGHVAGRPCLVLATAATTATGIVTRVGGTAVVRIMPRQPVS
ncbi:MAG TPA: PhzF family phenazine biosynthesis isomerase [Catenuloplanes sp.]